MKLKAIKKIALLAITLLLAGCLVPRTKYDAKVREAEELRNSYVEVSSENEKLKKLLAEIEKTVNSLKSELDKAKKELEAKSEENEKLKATVEELKSTYQSTKISRETLINELLQKEKSYSEKIKRLTVENTTLRGKLTSLTEELEAINDRAQKLSERVKTLTARNEELSKAIEEKGKEVEQARGEAEALRRKVHLLEGEIARLREESGDFIPYAEIRGQAIAALSDTVSSTHITRSLPLLFAEIPLDVALSPTGRKLSDDFKTFLKKLSKIINQSEVVRLDVVATGKTYTGKMEVLLKLKNEEISFLQALSKFLAGSPEVKKSIRKSGRQTLLDKLGKREIKTFVRIYLVKPE